MSIKGEILTEDFIGKKVICAMYNMDLGKKYGVVESFTDDTVSVRINGCKKLIQYSYDDIVLDFQNSEEF